tara:strand:- start:1322 stop:1549 length:228 start_codon:yes stop_codon:yes gene_type:complete
MPTHPCSVNDAINTCAGELPEGWQVRLDIELHGSGMSIIDPDGNEHDFDSGGESLADDFLYALELAKQKNNKEKP